jgi:biopolymer transport protein ExbD
MPLTASVLLVCTAVASLPALLASNPDPRERTGSASGTLGASGSVEPMLVMRSARGTWYLNGQPIAAESLAQVLARPGRLAGPVRLLASNHLSVAELSESLSWLHTQGRQQVALDVALEP